MMLEDEFARQLRVVDQMMTAHCVLRDTYERRALAQDVVTLSCSVLLAATTFLDPKVFDIIGVPGQRAWLTRGVAALVLFAMTVVGLRIRWKERSGTHRVAASALGELKLAGRSIDPASTPDKADAWLQEARRLLKSIPEIPDRLFLCLKARHLRKIEVSKMLSRRPGAWLPALRVAVWWRATFRQRRSDGSE